MVGVIATRWMNESDTSIPTLRCTAPLSFFADLFCLIPYRTVAYYTVTYRIVSYPPLQVDLKMRSKDVEAAIIIQGSSLVFADLMRKIMRGEHTSPDTAAAAADTGETMSIFWTTWDLFELFKTRNAVIEVKIIYRRGGFYWSAFDEFRGIIVILSGQLRVPKYGCPVKMWSRQYLFWIYNSCVAPLPSSNTCLYPPSFSDFSVLLLLIIVTASYTSSTWTFPVSFWTATLRSFLHSSFPPPPYFCILPSLYPSHHYPQSFFSLFVLLPPFFH